MRLRRGLSAFIGLGSLGLSLVALAPLGCTNPGDQQPAATEDVTPSRHLLTEAQQKSACALLDDPTVRPRLDGLEMKLMLLCGRAPMPAREEIGRRSESGERWQAARGASALTEASGDPDIALSNPALDVGGHTTQSETSTVAAGNVICASWNDAGENFGTNGFSGFGFSLDGGATFTDGGAFPNGPSDTNRGDPSMVYSVKDATFYYAALSTQGLSLWKSTTNCQSFQYVGPIHIGSSDDKELAAVDNTPTSPFFGRLYVGWTNFGASGDLNMAVFTDNGGATWSTPAPFPGSSSSGQGVYPAIAPNGDVYMALLKRTTPQDQIIYKSTNGGVSWAQATSIATGQALPQDATSTSSCGREALRGPIRYLPSPQIAITPDASAPAGYVVHSVYSYDADGAGPDMVDVFYKRSSDGAQTWSAEVKLNDDATTTDQFTPSIAASSTGGIIASWYDRRLDPNNLMFDRYATFSIDGGLTWLANRRLSDVSSNVGVNFDGLATCYHGDYDQVATAGATAYVVWSDDRRVVGSQPNPDIYEDHIVLGASVVASPTAFEGGTASTGAAFLGSTAMGDTTVTLTSSAPSLVTVPASIVIPSGSQSTTFPITSVSTSTETQVTLTAVFPGPVTATTKVTVLASPIPASLALAPTTVVGGSTSTATVTLSGPAPVGGALVTLASNNTAAATVPANLTIPVGATSGTFTVTSLAVAASANATITASFHNATKAATLTVTRAPQISTLTLAPGIVEGGRGTVTGTITLVDPAPGGGAAVTLASTNSGVASVPTTVTVTVGATSATFPITTSAVTAQTAVTISGTLPSTVTRSASLTVVPGPTVSALTFAPPSVQGGQPSTGTITLTGPAPGAGSAVTLSSTSTNAVVPTSVTIAAGAASGTFTVTTLAPAVDVVATISASLNGLTQSAPLTVTSPPGNATFDGTLRVPRCTTVDSFCDTGSTLVRGRDTMSGGNEPNQPNTIANSCADGTSGTFHGDESLDRVRISTVDGTPLAPGKMVRVDATVWVFSTSSNHLDVFFAPDANNPVWTSIASNLAATLNGLQTVSTTFTLPAGPLPAIRPQWRFNGSAVPCDTGSFSDRDDLVFAVGAGTGDVTPPTAAITAPSSGAIVKGSVTVTANASDDVSVSKVDLLVDGLVVATDTTAPYSFTLDTTTLTSAAHALVARATDSSGNLGSSAAVSISVDNAIPGVSITSPTSGTNVNGIVTVTASATDTGTGVASVSFLVDGTLLGTDTSAPYSIAWDTNAVVPGGHTLQAQATDGAGNVGSSVTITVNVVVNTAPAVNAGPDKTVTLPSTLAITGTVTDDGLPAPSALTIAWSRTSGPGTVTFSPANAASTTATFSAAGTYVLRLTASDGALSSFDELQVVVSSTTNTAPVVNAGPDKTVTLPSTLAITGTVTDDGLPTPPTLTITWSKTSGPGTVTFSPANAASTTATFSATGTYVLRLTASDGALSSFDELQVVVSSTTNTAPVVNAGPDKTVTLPSTLAITGTVTDDGLPTPPALTITWSRTSGPGTVTFSPTNAASTTATFSAAGTYILRLTASDGALSSFDELQVIVSASSGTTPCAGLCSNPTNFTVNGSFQSGNLGTGAVCYQTTSATIHGGNCGNFVSPRTLQVNGTTESCSGGNWSSLPARRNGGYCIQTTTGNQPWAFFTIF